MFPSTQSPTMTPSSENESEADLARMPYADDLVFFLSVGTPSQTQTPTRSASPGGGLGLGSPSVEARALPPAVAGEPPMRNRTDLGSHGGGDEESRGSNKRIRDANPVPPAKSPIAKTQRRKLPATFISNPPEVTARSKSLTPKRSPENPPAAAPPVADDDPPLNLVDCINILSKEPSRIYTDIDLLDLAKMKGIEFFPPDFVIFGSPGGGDEVSRASNKRLRDASPVPPVTFPTTSTRPKELPATITNPPPEVRARSKSPARGRSPENPRAAVPPVADDDPPLNLLDCINILSKESSRIYADIDLLDLVKMKGTQLFPPNFETPKKPQ